MKLKDNKGSITVFVLVGLLFMTMFLTISYAININKSKITKEQFDMISSIYSYNDGNANAYSRVYTALRNKNKQILTITIENNSIIELTKTYEEKLSNYKIYGNSTSLGTKITDTSDSNYGKYEIQVQVTSQDDTSTTYSIYLSSPLKKSGTLVDYIDYKNQKVVREVDSQTEEEISLPDIFTYEDYTKIQVLTSTPSMIELEYVGYTLD